MVDFLHVDGIQISDENSLQSINFPVLKTIYNIGTGLSQETISFNENLRTLNLPVLEVAVTRRFPIVVANNPNLETCNVVGCAVNDVCGTECTDECPWIEFPTDEICSAPDVGFECMGKIKLEKIEIY